MSNEERIAVVGTRKEVEEVAEYVRAQLAAEIASGQVKIGESAAMSTGSARDASAIDLATIVFAVVTGAVGSAVYDLVKVTLRRAIEVLKSGARLKTD